MSLVFFCDFPFFYLNLLCNICYDVLHRTFTIFKLRKHAKAFTNKLTQSNWNHDFVLILRITSCLWMEIKNALIWVNGMYGKISFDRISSLYLYTEYNIWIHNHTREGTENLPKKSSFCHKLQFDWENMWPTFCWIRQKIRATTGKFHVNV